MFTLEFIQGRPGRAFTEDHSLVITEKMAERFFGDDKNIIGKTLNVDKGSEDYIITGVIKDLPENSTLQFDWLAPFQIHYANNQWLQYWGSNGIQTFIELEREANPANINKMLSGYVHSKDPKSIVKTIPF